MRKTTSTAIALVVACMALTLPARNAGAGTFDACPASPGLPAQGQARVTAVLAGPDYDIQACGIVIIGGSQASPATACVSLRIGDPHGGFQTDGACGPATVHVADDLSRAHLAASLATSRGSISMAFDITATDGPRGLATTQAGHVFVGAARQSESFGEVMSSRLGRRAGAGEGLAARGIVIIGGRQEMS